MENQLMSLYDYLGKAAGPELGKQVYEYASEKKLTHLVKNRNIKNPKFKGKVLLYPKSLLDIYFQDQTQK
jgi:hypothetical protein